MAGSTTRGGIRGQKIAGGPEWQREVVEPNTPERFQPESPDTTGNPFYDVETGKPYPGAPGSN